MLDQKYPPNRRLHASWEYKNFFGPNHKKRFGPFVVYRIPNTLGHSRLGITVRGAPTALVRNKMKRWTRETFRKQKDQLGSFDFNAVVSLKGPVGFEEIRKFRARIEKEFSAWNLPS